MSSTEAISQRDVKTLTLSFENLGSPSPGTKKPFSSCSESSDGEASDDDSGSNSINQFLPELPEYMVPYNEVNCQRLPTYSLVGRDDSHIDKSRYRPCDEGSIDKSWYRPCDEGLNRQPTVPYTQPSFRAPVSREGVYIEKRPPVPCSECSKEHPPYSYCPYAPCKVCYKLHHPTDCPYFRHIPEGAAFNQDKYVIACHCGNVFNVDKWVCTFCTGRWPLLKAKYCAICHCYAHCTYECPKDTVLAAKYKSVRDHDLSVGRNLIPYDEVCALRASSGQSSQRDS